MGLKVPRDYTRSIRDGAIGTWGKGERERVLMNSTSQLLQPAKIEETVMQPLYQNNRYQGGGDWLVRGNLSTHHLALSTSVQNKVRVFGEATAEEQLGREIVCPAMRAQDHLTVQATPGL